MKKTLILTFIALASVSAQAKSISCDIQTYVATRSGLMPAGEVLEMQAVVGRSEADCGNANLLGYDLELCATETEMIGGYEVELKSKLSGTQGVKQNDSATWFGTSKKNQQLIDMSGISFYKDSVISKLEAADIEVKYEADGDTLIMDNAMVEGIKKGILRNKEVVLFELGICKIGQ